MKCKYICLKTLLDDLHDKESSEQEWEKQIYPLTVHGTRCGFFRRKTGGKWVGSGMEEGKCLLTDSFLRDGHLLPFWCFLSTSLPLLKHFYHIQGGIEVIWLTHRFLFKETAWDELSSHVKVKNPGRPQKLYEIYDDDVQLSCISGGRTSRGRSLLWCQG